MKIVKFFSILFLSVLFFSCTQRGERRGEERGGAGDCFSVLERDSLAYAGNIIIESFPLDDLSEISTSAQESEVGQGKRKRRSERREREERDAQDTDEEERGYLVSVGEKRYLLVPKSFKDEKRIEEWRRCFGESRARGERGERGEKGEKGEKGRIAGEPVVIRTPVEKGLVYSSLHCGLLDELGAGKAIGGVCDARYITDRKMRSRIEKGEVADCGESMNPDIEKIITLNPDLIMISPLGNNERYEKLRRLGIPIVECSDYMESSALGQAEWMKFYGLLFGKGKEAQKRFDGIAERYNTLKASVREKGGKRERKSPKVIMDCIYGQSWSVPGGESTIGRMIEDAGGVNPFARLKSSGGVMLAPEKVLAEAGDADVWLLRYNRKGDKTLRELSRDNPVYSQFKAFKLGEVYGCNTDYVAFFDETPFNPDRLLEEMVKIFEERGERGDGNLRYFKRMR